MWCEYGLPSPPNVCKMCDQPHITHQQQKGYPASSKIRQDQIPGSRQPGSCTGND